MCPTISGKQAILELMLRPSKGELFSYRQTRSFFPTKGLVESGGKEEPRVMEIARVGIVSGYVLQEKDGMLAVPLSQAYLSMNLNSWIRMESGLLLSKEEVNGLGELVDEPVPPAYSRSYSRITSLSDTRVGRDDIIGMLSKAFKPEYAGFAYDSFYSAIAGSAQEFQVSTLIQEKLGKEGA